MGLGGSAGVSRDGGSGGERAPRPQTGERNRLRSPRCGEGGRLPKTRAAQRRGGVCSSWLCRCGCGATLFLGPGPGPPLWHQALPLLWDLALPSSVGLGSGPARRARGPQGGEGPGDAAGLGLGVSDGGPLAGPLSRGRRADGGPLAMANA